VINEFGRKELKVYLRKFKIQKHKRQLNLKSPSMGCLSLLRENIFES